MVDRVEVYHVSSGETGGAVEAFYVDAIERIKRHPDEWSRKPFSDAAAKKWTAKEAARENDRRIAMRNEGRHAEIGESLAAAPSVDASKSAAEILEQVKAEAGKVAQQIIADAQKQAEAIIANVAVESNKAKGS